MTGTSFYEPSANEDIEKLWLGSLGHLDNSQSVFQEVLAAYRQPGRYYHTIEHASQVAESARQLSGGLSRHDADLLSLAAWTHDLYYSVAGKDDEARSADIAMGMCTRMGFSDADAQVVRNLILVSSHRVAPTSHLQEILCDADLATLAKPWPQYQADVACIRTELAVESTNEWHAIRHFVIGFFDEKQPLYYLDESAALWEAMARSNLAREKSMLPPPP